MVGPIAGAKVAEIANIASPIGCFTFGSSVMMRGNPDGGVQGRPKGVARANVQQLKLMGRGHPTGLTPNLLKLFEARPPLEHKPPVEKRKLPAYTGMAQFVSRFAEPGDPEYAPPVPTCETKAEKKDRIRKLKLEQGAAKVAEELQKHDPQSDPNATGDPYKTRFVARLMIGGVPMVSMLESSKSLHCVSLVWVVRPSALGMIGVL